MKIIYLSLLLLSLTSLGSVTSSYAQETTPTTTQTPVPPTNTPDLIDSELPENAMIGPPVPRQMMQQQQQQQQQQQGQQGDVESAFSDGGPENIFDTKPNDTTGSVIKIIVTVIALTFTGIIWWLAMKTNREIVAGERSETKTIDETSLPK